MTLDEFDYLVRNTQIQPGADLCFHVMNGAQITGTVSKLARYSNRVIGVELSYEIPQEVPPDALKDAAQSAVTSATEAQVMATRASEHYAPTLPIPVIAEPDDLARLRKLKATVAQSRVYIPASVVIAVEWVTL